MGKKVELFKKPPHIFTRVVFDLIPEISYSDLTVLSQLVTNANREKIYFGLIDCLVKINWAKLAGLEAISTEQYIIDAFKPSQSEEGDYIFDPIGYIVAGLLEKAPH